MINQYAFYIEWPQVEPDVDLIIPSIKDDIASAKLTKAEVDALRSRVMYIKTHGHAKYLENDPVAIVKEMFEGSIELEDFRKPMVITSGPRSPELQNRVGGSCQARVK